MNVYTTDKIRNVVILGHGGAGKTSLVESMAYLSGITSRLGNVAEGNTISDYDKEEIKRKFSISTSMVPIIWGDTKINILDTPGYFDFVGEAEEAAAAADAAIIVVMVRMASRSERRRRGICVRSISFRDSSMFRIWTTTMPATVRLWRS